MPPPRSRSAHAAAAPLSNAQTPKAIGTGPFTFVSYKPGSEVRLKANPDYFMKVLPHLDEVVLRIIPDQGNQVVSLESGEVQWLIGVPGPDLPRLRDSENEKFLTTPVNPGGSNCIMTVS